MTPKLPARNYVLLMNLIAGALSLSLLSLSLPPSSSLSLSLFLSLFNADALWGSSVL